MKIKNRLITLIGAVLLSALLLAALIMPIYAARLDYSSPGATNKTTLSSADILEILFSSDDGFAMTEEERAYLEEYGTESVTYGENVPASAVTSEYDEEGQRLYVSSREYKYRSASGINMTWTPTRVTFDGREELLVNGGDGNYTAILENVDGMGASAATVIYEASISFSESTVNTLLTKAYNDGKGWNAYKTYVSELADYKTALAAYRQYLVDKQIYNDRYKEYTKYLADKAAYDEAYAAFLEYEAALAEYNAAHAAYVKYVAEKEEYDKNIILYNEYVKNIKIANEQIGIMLGTSKSLPTIGRPLSGAILGPTVAQVVENKDAIANELTGVDGSIIDLAGECTENLREILSEFASLTNNADRYTYYSLNYESIRYNFTTLFQVLDYLYGNGKVRYALGEMDMKEKYMILLAQLYYTVNALNDKTVYNYEGTAKYNSSYRINGKTPLSIVEGAPYIVDTQNAKPLENGYPVEVTEPILPTEVSEPTKPAAVPKPVAPTVVADPGESPEEVALPAAPNEVKAPDASLLDSEGALPDGIVALIDAYNGGKLTERAPISGAKIITLEARAVKTVLNPDEITVNFYSHTGTLLATVKAERGAYVEFDGELPSKTSPDKIYTFIGWCDEGGVPVDMTSLDPDGKTVDLYPHFSSEDKTFEVIWDVEGALTAQTYKYGQTPVPPVAEPTKADEGSYLFLFDGWDREISAVTSDATYTATFKRRPIIVDTFGIVGQIDYDSDPDAYVVDMTSSLDRELQLSNLLARATAEMKGIVLKLRVGEVRMNFSEASAIYKNNVTRLRVSFVTRGEGDSINYTFYIRFTDESGAEAEGEYRATVTLPCVLPYPDSTEICYLDGDARVSQRFETGEGSITLSMYSGRTYYTFTSFSVNVVTYDGITLKTDRTLASAGETVRVSYTVPSDVRILSVYYVDESGERTKIEDGSFEMPVGAVSVGIDYRYVKYTVRFISDGRVISSREYSPGQMPAPAGTPYKASDAAYEYVFVGWDKELSPVSGNEIYTAVYEKKLIEREPPKEGLQVTDRVLKIIVLVAVVLIYAFVLLTVLVAIVVKLVICRGKIDKEVRKSKK